MEPITGTIILGKAVQAGKHAIFRTISVLCVIAVIALLGLGVKRILYPKASESYQQKAEQITNIEHNLYPNKKVFGIGITLWGFDIGIMKYDYPKEIKNK
jgi:hypothetical protein